MSGEWIKMRGNLWNDPRVAGLVDRTDSAEATVIGALYWLWATADEHTEDGELPGLTAKQIDRKTGLPGFAAALCDIGWLVISDTGARIIRFDEHNGQSAKRRCAESRRKMSARDADKLRNGAHLEEEGEEEKKDKEPPAAPDTPPAPPEPTPLVDPAAPAAKPAKPGLMTFDRWVTHLSETGQKAIPTGHSTLAYAEQVGLPPEFLRLHWLTFQRRYAGTAKRYSDWRLVFLKSVKENWLKLWAISSDGEYYLTTVGKQAHIEFTGDAP
jgi:hypothetical protein